MQPNPPVDPTRNQFGQSQPQPSVRAPGPGPGYPQSSWNNPQQSFAPQPPYSTPGQPKGLLGRLSAVMLTGLSVATVLSFFLPTFEFNSRSQIIRSWSTNRQTLIDTSSGQTNVLAPHSIIAVILLFGLALAMLALAAALWIRSGPRLVVAVGIIAGAATFRALNASMGPIEIALRQANSHTLTGTYTLLVGGLLGLAACVLLVIQSSKRI